MKINYAKRVEKLKASDVRELLKVAENKDIISFGGGLPAPELFPIEDILKANTAVLTEDGREALQYSSTEGFCPLREWIVRRLEETQNCRQLAVDNVLITSGSQQALDLTGKLFLESGDVVLCESPTYMAAISAFRVYGCDFMEMPTDDQGMLMDDLEETLKQNENVKLIYAIPNFQNPSGRSWSLERRQKLAELASKYQVAVIEDNPYGELRFDGTPLPSVQSFDTDGYVLYLGTFSKIYCPGYRVGWIAGHQDIINKYVMAKQGADLQSNTLAQREISKYLEMYDIDAHIEKIRKVYHHRRDLAVETIEKYFPKEVLFTRPEGGLFLWLTLPKHMNSRNILEKALKRGVAFVPGSSFFPNSAGNHHMRINFSNMEEERLVRGLKILGELLSEEK